MKKHKKLTRCLTALLSALLVVTSQDITALAQNNKNDFAPTSYVLPKSDTKPSKSEKMVVAGDVLKELIGSIMNFKSIQTQQIMYISKMENL